MKSRTYPIAVVLFITACASIASARQSRPAYLALGGANPSNPSETGYVTRLATQLSGVPSYRGRNIEGINLAAAVENPSTQTTAAIVAPGGQLDKAKAVLAARNQDALQDNNVEIVIVDLGGHDFAALVRPGQACGEGARSASCMALFSDALKTFAANLNVILGSLRSAAGMATTIVCVTPYNPYSGTRSPLDTPEAAALAGQIGSVIKSAAANPAINARVVDLAPLFEGKGAQLTNILRFDAQASDEGHDLIARTIAAVVERGATPAR